MGIGSWWRRLRSRGDEAAVARAQEQRYETPDERHETAGGIEGLDADQRAARHFGEGNVEDAERLADD